MTRRLKIWQITIGEPIPQDGETIRLHRAGQMSEWLAAPLETLHALYRLDVNEYRGERRAQLVIQSFWSC